MSNVVPNLPPLSSIADPVVRSALQAIANWMAVRDGQLAGGKNKFLTEAEVGAAVTNYVFGGSSTNVSYPQGANPGSVAPVLDGLRRAVLNSAEFLALREQIKIIQTPAWMVQAMQQAQGPYAERIEVIAARLGDAQAAIGSEQVARVTMERAVVSNLKLMIAQFGESTAGITTMDEAIATYASAQAYHAQQTYASVGDFTAAVEHTDTVLANINGVTSAMYTLRVSTGNVVSGMAFGSSTDSAGQTTSRVVFAANTFAIAGVGNNPVTPFVVDTVNNRVLMTNVGISGNLVVDGTITASKINTGAVTTDKIEAGAVSQGWHGTYAGGTLGIGAYTLLSVQIPPGTVIPLGTVAVVISSGFVFPAGHGDISFPAGIDVSPTAGKIYSVTITTTDITTVQSGSVAVLLLKR